METQQFKTLIVQARVRYWEDAEINGISDEEGGLIPFKEGDSWNPIIDLTTGKIKDWPADKHADIHFKVCDAGEYWLGDADGNRLAKWRDHYVPDDFLAVGDDGYGDYIIMRVNCDGQIEGWEFPEIDIEQWDMI